MLTGTARAGATQRRPLCKTQGKSPLTDDKTREEGIDPSHDQRLRNHHSHISLHHAHHAFHGRRVAHRIRPRLAPLVRLSQELAFLVRRHHVRLPSLERRGRQHVRIAAQVDAAHQCALLPDLRELLLLGRRLEERHGVVAEDARQDLWTCR